MKTRRLRSLLVGFLTFSALALVAAGLLADEPQIQVGPARPAARLDLCATVEPAAVLVFEGANWGVSSTSVGTTYTASGCGHYVFDVRVGQFADLVSAAGSHAANAFRLSSMLHGLYLENTTSPMPNQQNCPTARLHARYYRRGARDSSFTAIGGGTLVGQWITGNHPHCELQPQGTFNDPGDIPAPRRGTVTYRLAISGTYQGQPHRVYGGARRPMVP